MFNDDMHAKYIYSSIYIDDIVAETLIITRFLTTNLFSNEAGVTKTEIRYKPPLLTS